MLKQIKETDLPDAMVDVHKVLANGDGASRSCAVTDEAAGLVDGVRVTCLADIVEVARLIPGHWIVSGDIRGLHSLGTWTICKKLLEAVRIITSLNNMHLIHCEK